MKLLSVIAISAGLALGAAGLATAQDQTMPAADPAAAQNPALKSSKTVDHAPLAKGHNSFTKGEARARLRKAGYADVKGLTLDGDGLWQATAMQNGQSVHVALDYKGDVASQ